MSDQARLLLEAVHRELFEPDKPRKPKPSSLNLERLAELRKTATPVTGELDRIYEQYPGGSIYLVFRGEAVVYVGHTTRHIRTRLSDHRKERAKGARGSGSLLGAALMATPDAFTVAVIDERDRTLVNGGTGDMEDFLIRTLRPEFNRAGLTFSKRTGEARRRYVESEQAQQEGARKAAIEAGFIAEVSPDFRRWGHTTQSRLFGHFHHYADQLSKGQPVDIGQVRWEALALIREELEALEKALK